jgi:hypothetical protein
MSFDQAYLLLNIPISNANAGDIVSRLAHASRGSFARLHFWRVKATASQSQTRNV